MIKDLENKALMQEEQNKKKRILTYIYFLGFTIVEALNSYINEFYCTGLEFNQCNSDAILLKTTFVPFTVNVIILEADIGSKLRM